MRKVTHGIHGMTGGWGGSDVSHLSVKSCAKGARFRNPKSEVRNPKQVKIRMRKYSNVQRACFFGCFDFSSIVSDFEIRDSRRCAWFRLRRVVVWRAASNADRSIMAVAQRKPATASLAFTFCDNLT